jgi:hypothetical protein
MPSATPDFGVAFSSYRHLLPKMLIQMPSLSLRATTRQWIESDDLCFDK